jgi:DNA-binding response OmpR family regulator
MSDKALNKKILVIEDDPDIRLGYQVLLRSNNFDTFFAADGMTAISEGRKVQPDLILLDLGLPAGDGFVVLERLKTNLQLAMVPVIVVSGRDIAASRDRALKAGAKAFLQKPWDDHELLSTIYRLLGNSQASMPQAQARGASTNP